jgi:hypothetical protein
MAKKAKPPRLATAAARKSVRLARPNGPLNSPSLLDRQARRVREFVPIWIAAARVVAELAYGSPARSP